MTTAKLAMTAEQHAQLKSHLFPDDNCEAAAIVICGRAGANGGKLCVQAVIEVPYNACSVRTPTRLKWPGNYLDDALDMADPTGASILLLHSHPGGMFDFSIYDDESDRIAIPCLFHGMSDMKIPHGSAIMVPNGAIRARLYDEQMKVTAIDRIVSYGSDIVDLANPFPVNIMAFSSDMTAALSCMTVCIVGVSGTGSIVAEQLARMGVGKLILIDFDVVKLKNLNRILNATIRDADNKRAKTLVTQQAIASYQPTTTVVTVETSISKPRAIIAASEADAIFSCVDTMEGRHYCDLMASAFVTPLIDLGVTIPTRKTEAGGRAIAEVCGRVDYVFPGGSSLGDRNVWTSEGLRREHLQRVAPENLKDQIAAGYFKGIPEEAPSVISLNMRAASTAVNEWLFRMFKVRADENELFASTYFSLVHSDEEHTAERDIPNSPSSILGRGLQYPLLGLPALNKPRKLAA